MTRRVQGNARALSAAVPPTAAPLEETTESVRVAGVVRDREATEVERIAGVLEVAAWARRLSHRGRPRRRHG